MPGWDPLTLENHLQKMADPNDWSWVKVKKWVPPAAPCDCELSQALDAHHQKEVGYLRKVIAELATHLLNYKEEH